MNSVRKRLKLWLQDQQLIRACRARIHSQWHAVIKELGPVANIFTRLKHVSAIATNCDQLKPNHEAMLALPCGFLWLAI